MKLIRTVLLASSGALVALAGYIGSPPAAEGQDACVHASVDDGIVTTTVHHDTGWCPPITPEDPDFPCPEGLGASDQGQIIVEYEFLVCIA